ncbi:MAG: TIR domain-containing protein [Chitinophagaceae bacterium]
MNFDKKKEIDGSDDLYKYLGRKKIKFPGDKKAHYDYAKVSRQTFENIYFKGSLQGVEFNSCKFKNCEFDGVFGFFLVLKKCKFYDCQFRQTRFRRMEMEWDDVEFHKCHLKNVDFDEGCVWNIFFFNCTLTSFSMVSLDPMSNVIFQDCEIDQSYFSHLQSYKEGEAIDDEFPDISFEDCRIDHTFFNTVDLRNGYFFDTMLFKTSFMDCHLGKNTFFLSKELKFESYAAMDFQTIVKSEPLDKKIMKTLFNIPDAVNLKKIVGDMIKPKIFSTVFISYSFKDSSFATRLNEVLNKKGIRTFLWEKDAAGGSPLDEIMTSGINEHDKLLFIASENSIRSKACQYEITTARKKQEQSWENVFFPIFIDRYLFAVKKSDIRPIETAVEYWENIEEIKRVNALDFSIFNTAVIVKKVFDKAVNKIVEGLKIDN